MVITTWNMRGGTQQGNLGTLINDNNPDVICLQECGNMTGLLQNQPMAPLPIAGFPNSLSGMYKNGDNIYDVVFWYNNVNLLPTCSLAIMSRITVNAFGIFAAVPSPVYQPANPRNLPWMRVNQGGNLLTIYSYHAPSAGTVNACAYNNVQIAAISGLGGSWAVVGDFNADPTDAVFVNPPAGGVVRGNQETQQSKGLLDYSITNAAGYAFLAAGMLVTGSDHYPQDFTV